jgi:hypothetical protein
MNILRVICLCALGASILSTDAFADEAKNFQHAHWEEISVSSTDVVYIDKTSILRTYGTNIGGAHDVLTATASFLINYSQWEPDGSLIDSQGRTLEKPNADSPKFSSTVMLVKFDCQKSESITLQTTAFRGHMGSGKVVESDGVVRGWVSDNSDSNAQWESLACNGFPYGYLKNDRSN